MDYIEESARRKELIARLKERMLPLYRNYDLQSKQYEHKVIIEFGSTADDFDLLQDLVNALIGDVLYFEVEICKIRESGE